MEINVAIKNMINPWVMTSMTNVNNAMEIQTKIDDQNRIVWNLRLFCRVLRRIEPANNPADLQKNRNEYYVYLWPVISARYGINGPTPAIAVAYNIKLIQ